MDVNFGKYADGLVPAIVQDEDTLRVLMLGFMNEAALAETRASGKVTFYSRSKKRLWTKGEESGHFLLAGDIRVDCDQDTLLVKARPQGPTCHTGADTCWGEDNKPGDFLSYLESIIASRKTAAPETSYTAKLLSRGINKVAQKVGEEAVELVIEAKDNDKTLFMGEAADLLFHYMVLLQAKGYTLAEVIEVLKERHAK
jgi:phosphoribosyl-ATP pyrophosphohydrolase/phosphoribosyl-AMP cyclohydrolase